MCTNKYWTKNIYTGRLVLSNCGKCKACLQEKADARAKRIRNTVADGYSMLFVNLDYDNKYVPYIKRQDIFNVCCRNAPFVYVNRDYFNRYEKRYHSFLRKKLRGNGFTVDYERDEFGKRKFDVVLSDWKNIVGLRNRVLYTDFQNYSERDYKNFDFGDLRSFHGYDVKDKIGVLWYPDFQKFMKRFRINLKRKYNYNDNFYWFVCAEYGSKFNRPHWHILFIGRRGFESVFADCVCESWTFCDWDSPGQKGLTKRDDRILIGFDGVEKYVSSYVNCLSNLPTFFQKSPFSPRWEYSHSFGIGKEHTSFQAIEEMFNRRDLRYTARIRRDKTVATLRIPVETYVINRYFPKFKGFRCLVGSNLCGFIRRCLADKGDAINLLSYAVRTCRLQYDWQNAYDVVTMIKNKFKKLHRLYNISVDRFVEMYSQIWTIRSSNLLRMFHEEDVFRQSEQYDNVNFCRHSDSGFLQGVKFVYDSTNQFPSVIARTKYFEDRFSERYKHAYINDDLYCLT